MSASINEVAAIVEDGRLAGLLAHARAITGSTEPEIGPCVAWALRMLGYSTALIAAPTDNEVSAVPDSRVDALLDLVELRLLQDVQGNLSSVTNRAGPVQDDWNDIARRVGEMVTAKLRLVSAQHGHLLVHPLTDDAQRRVVLRTI